VFLTGRQISPDGPAVVSPPMKLGDVANPQPPEWPRPLAGITVLAAEQMQALPYATQLLGRLGADIIKVEHPTAGDSGRGALPAMTDPEGRPVGATFLRNNLGKRSVGLDLKSARGRELFVELAGTVDVVAREFQGGHDGAPRARLRRPRRPVSGAGVRVGVRLRQPRRLALCGLACVRHGPRGDVGAVRLLPPRRRTAAGGSRPAASATSVRGSSP
jgi:hypothetical protein